MRRLLLASLHSISHQSPLLQIVKFTCTSRTRRKKPVHLLNLDTFLKKSQETEVNPIVVTPNIFPSSESLEFTMIHQVTPNVSSFSEYFKFFHEFLQISVSPNDVIPLVVFDTTPRKLIYYL